MNMIEAEVVRTSLLSMAAQRGPHKSICPSEVARALAADWRPLMPAVRAVSFDLAEAGRVKVTQRGRVVGRDVRGPIRIAVVADAT